ncbi:MAG TPA: hypothetical protein VM689_03900 [Aliidongia sp.]|nr:hypothetical protein [Aliidongia sp.]
MSDIVTHPTTLANPKPGADTVSYLGMPLGVTTEFKHKKVRITIPGKWQGSLDQNGIKMTTEPTPDQANTIIKYHFTGSLGASAEATLTSTDDPSVQYSMTLTCLE